jgi:hypothetical protein
MSAGLDAIITRLLLVFALALFGASRDLGGRAAAKAGPAAASQIEFTPIILTAHSHILRAQLPVDDTPQITVPVSMETAAADATLARIDGEQGKPLSMIDIYILPPVRGPPAV